MIIYDHCLKENIQIEDQPSPIEMLEVLMQERRLSWMAVEGYARLYKVTMSKFAVRAWAYFEDNDQYYEVY